MKGDSLATATALVLVILLLALLSSPMVMAQLRVAPETLSRADAVRLKENDESVLIAVEKAVLLGDHSKILVADRATGRAIIYNVRTGESELVLSPGTFLSDSVAKHVGPFRLNGHEMLDSSQAVQAGVPFRYGEGMMRNSFVACDASSDGHIILLALVRTIVREGERGGFGAATNLAAVRYDSAGRLIDVRVLGARHGFHTRSHIPIYPASRLFHWNDRDESYIVSVAYIPSSGARPRDSLYSLARYDRDGNPVAMLAKLPDAIRALHTGYRLYREYLDTNDSGHVIEVNTLVPVVRDLTTGRSVELRDGMLRNGEFMSLASASTPSNPERLVKALKSRIQALACLSEGRIGLVCMHWLSDSTSPARWSYREYSKDGDLLRAYEVPPLVEGEIRHAYINKLQGTIDTFMRDHEGWQFVRYTLPQRGQEVHAK